MILLVGVINTAFGIALMMTIRNWVGQSTMAVAEAWRPALADLFDTHRLGTPHQPEALFDLVFAAVAALASHRILQPSGEDDSPDVQVDQDSASPNTGSPVRHRWFLR